MTIDVSPTSLKPTHHVKLAKGSDQIGLLICNPRDGQINELFMGIDPHPSSGLHMFTGQQTHSDREPPFSDLEQNDWTAGINHESIQQNSSGYRFGHRIDTTFEGMALPGVQEILTKGMRTAVYSHMPYDNSGYDVTYKKLTARFIAFRFVAAANSSAPDIRILLQPGGAQGEAANPTNNPSATIYGEITGAPGTQITTPDETDLSFDDYLSFWVIRSPGIGSGTLVSGTAYWVVIDQGADFDSTHYWYMGWNNDSGGGTYVKTSSNGTAWANGWNEKGPYFRIEENGDVLQFKPIFFKYKKAQYCITQWDAIGTAPKMWILGDQGIATSGSATSLTDSSKTGGAAWETNEHAGAFVVFFEGTGSNQHINWSKIASNTGSQLNFATVSVAPGAGTGYAIVGAKKWREITGHGLTGPVTDVLVVNNGVYFAQGDSVVMRRMRRYNNGSNVWTNDWGTETAYASFLKLLPDGKYGNVIWKATRAGSIAYVSAPDLSGGGAVSALSFSTDQKVGDIGANITGLAIAGEPAKLWVLKEDGLGYYDQGVMVWINLAELRNVLDYRNGDLSGNAGPYLYLSILNTLERLYNSNLDNVGPTRGIGLPDDFRGDLSGFIAYLDRKYLAVDGGGSNYSSIFVNNGTGWHPFYTATIKGRRIRSLEIMNTPGDEPDYLLHGEGNEIFMLPLYTSNPWYGISGNWYFTHESALETSLIGGYLADIDKYWHAIKLDYSIDDLGANEDLMAIYLDYTYEGYLSAFNGYIGAVRWIPLGAFTGSNVEKLFSASNDLEKNQIRIRLRFYTSQKAYAPKLNAINFSVLQKFPVKHVYTMDFRLSDMDTDLRGQKDDTPLAADKLALLQQWEASPSPIIMNNIRGDMNNKWVTPIPGSLRSVQHRRENDRWVDIYKIRLIEVADYA